MADLSWLGGALGAAGSIAGGLFGGNRESPEDHFWDNYNMQKEFAQNGIRWRVEDAKNAGLHPLAALGSAGASYTPSTTIGDSGPQTDLSWLSETGQNIGRAINAKATERERARNEAYQQQANELQLENMKLQNESIKFDMVRQAALDAERAARWQQQVPKMQSFDTRADGAVISGQGDAKSSSLFSVKPPELWANHPGTPFAEAGSHPEVKWARTSDGGYSPVRSQAMEEALEDDLVGSLSWNVRNRLAPFVMGEAYNSPPPREFLPGNDFGWAYNVWKGSYYPYRRDSDSDYYRARFGYSR